MVKKGYTPEQIIGKLREAEIHLSQGASIAEASKKIGVTEQTYIHTHIREFLKPNLMSECDPSRVSLGIPDHGLISYWIAFWIGVTWLSQMVITHLAYLLHSSQPL